MERFRQHDANGDGRLSREEGLSLRTGNQQRPRRNLRLLHGGPKRAEPARDPWLAALPHGRFHQRSAAEGNRQMIRQYLGLVAAVSFAWETSAGCERMTMERPVKRHGSFHRVGGPNALWERAPIKECSHPQQPGSSLRTAQLRGLNALSALDGKGDALLVARLFFGAGKEKP